MRCKPSEDNGGTGRPPGWTGKLHSPLHLLLIRPTSKGALHNRYVIWEGYGKGWPHSFIIAGNGRAVAVMANGVR